MWIRRRVTWVFCWSWPWCGRVWEQGLDSQAKSWGLTFPRAVSLCSSPSQSPGAPVSPPVFLRLAPAVVPGTSHSRREGPARSWDHVQGRAGGGDPGGAPRQHPQPPISSSVSVSSHRYVPEFGFFIFKVNRPMHFLSQGISGSIQPRLGKDGNQG